MPHGLPRKIRIAFILQAVLASLGILLGAWLVSLVIKHSLVGAALRDHDCLRLIHGHTHRPAHHRLDLDGRPAERIVLGDWYEQESWFSA